MMAGVLIGSIAAATSSRRPVATGRSRSSAQRLRPSQCSCSRASASRPRSGSSAIYLLVLGLGLGMVMQVLVLAAQNAVPYKHARRRDVRLDPLPPDRRLVRRLDLRCDLRQPARLRARRSDSPGVHVPAAANPAIVHQLPAAVRQPYIEAFTAAIHPIFLAAAGFAIVAFLLTWLLREVPLRDDQRGRRDRRELRLSARRPLRSRARADHQLHCQRPHARRRSTSGSSRRAPRAHTGRGVATRSTRHAGTLEHAQTRATRRRRSRSSPPTCSSEATCRSHPQVDVLELSETGNRRGRTRGGWPRRADPDRLRPQSARAGSRRHPAAPRGLVARRDATRHGARAARGCGRRLTRLSRRRPSPPAAARDWGSPRRPNDGLLRDRKRRPCPCDDSRVRLQIGGRVELEPPPIGRPVHLGVVVAAAHNTPSISPMPASVVSQRGSPRSDRALARLRATE